MSVTWDGGQDFGQRVVQKGTGSVRGPLTQLHCDTVIDL